MNSRSGLLGWSETGLSALTISNLQIFKFSNPLTLQNIHQLNFSAGQKRLLIGWGMLVMRVFWPKFERYA